MTRKWLVALVLAASVALISCSPSGDTKLDGRLLQAGKPFSYQLQSLVESDENVTYEATLADGSVLPGWLKFDAATLTFSGVAPTAGTEAQGTRYDIRVTAKGMLLKLGSVTIPMQVATFPTVVPEIVNPPEELQEFDARGILRWTEPSATDTYEVWAYTDAALTQVAEFSGRLTSRQYQFTKLAANQLHYVKIYFRIGGMWREAPVFQLRTVTPVLKPRLSNAQDELDAFAVGGLFRWSPVQGAGKYEVWVYLDKALQTLVETSGPIMQTQYRSTNLAPDTTYYVVVYSQVGGNFHAGGALPVTVMATSTSARVLNPQEELDAFATNGVLRWTAVTGASAYEVWIFTNPNSSVSYESSGSLTTRSYQARTLVAGATYYVQIYAMVEGQWHVGAPAKVTTAQQVTIARLTNPQEELEAFSATGTVRWSEVPGATSYEVHLFTNAGLGVDADTSGPVTGTSYQVRRLCSSASYYAVVYAFVNGVWTNGWATPVRVTQGTSPDGCTAPAPVVRLTATPAAITRRGDTVRLSWTSQFANTCRAEDGPEGWAGPKTPNGEQDTAALNTLELTTVFTMVCDGPTGSSKAQALVGFKRPDITARGQVIEMAYDSLFDVFSEPDPAQYPNIRVQPDDWHVTRMLDDLGTVVDVDAYDFVLIYTSQEVPGWIYYGYKYQTVPAKNIGLANILYGNRRPGFKHLRGVAHMNSVQVATEQLALSTDWTWPVGVAVHELAHHWAIFMVRDTGIRWDSWNPQVDPAAYVAAVYGHWSPAMKNAAPESGLPGVLYSAATSLKFNAFDLYAMGLMSYEEASTYSYKLAMNPPPLPPGTLYTLTLDDMIYGMKASQPNNVEGDGRRIPATDPTVAHLDVLAVIVRGRDETISPVDLSTIQRVAAELPDAWASATWYRSGMGAGVSDDTAQGIWTGTVYDAARGTTNRGLALITKDGRADFGIQPVNSTDSLAEFFGSVTASGADATANLTGIAKVEHGFQWADGSTQAAFTFSGTVVPGATFKGTYTGANRTEWGEFAFDYDADLYERPSSLAAVAGTWSTDEPMTSSDYAFSFDVGSNGTLTGEDSLGCRFNGSVSVVNPARNYYNLDMVVSNCGGEHGVPNGSYSGLGLLADSDETHHNDTFMFGVNNGGVIFSDDMYRGTGERLGIAIADRSQAEGNTGSALMNFTVTLSQGAFTPVSFDYTTVDGTARAGIDYSATSGRLVIGANSSSGTISVPILGNTTEQPSRTFTMQLSNASANAIIQRGAATGTILDDDGGAVGVSIADSQLAEGNSGSANMGFVVTLDRAASAPVTVHWTTSPGTATPGEDYGSFLGVFTIDAGQTTHTINVPVYGDTVPEPDQTFTVQLTSVSANATIVRGLATGTILNDDGAVPVVGVSIADKSQAEGAGSMLFNITLDAASSSEVTFNLRTVDGTAVGGVDYIPVNRTSVKIPAGSTSLAMSVTLYNDNMCEADELFSVELSNLTANARIVRGTATGTILNDDTGSTCTTTPGIWYGSFSEGGTSFPARVLVTEDGTSWFMLLWEGATDPRYSMGMLFPGPVPTTGTSFTTNLLGTMYYDNHWSNGDLFAQVQLTSTVTPQAAWNGTFSGGGDAGTFALTYQKDIYERPASAATIAGTYSGIQTHDTGYEYTVTFTIAADLALTGSDNRGCQYVGTVSRQRSDRNYYGLNVNVLNCPVTGQLDDQPDGNYLGLAFFDGTGSNFTRLLYMTRKSGGRPIWVGAVYRQ